MDINTGEIYLARLDLKELKEFKGQRPVIIVSDDLVNRYCDDVEVIPLTTMEGMKQKNRLVTLALECGLEAEYTAIIGSKTKISKKKLIKKIGICQSEKMDYIQSVLNIL